MSCFHEEKLGVGERVFTQRDADLELEMGLVGEGKCVCSLGDLGSGRRN